MKLWKFLTKEIYPWPYLELYIDTGFLTIATELLHHCYVDRTYCYIGLRIKLFWRWEFRFRLYRPERS